MKVCKKSSFEIVGKQLEWYSRLFYCNEPKLRRGPEAEEPYNNADVVRPWVVQLLSRLFYFILKMVVFVQFPKFHRPI